MLDGEEKLLLQEMNKKLVYGYYLSFFGGGIASHLACRQWGIVAKRAFYTFGGAFFTPLITWSVVGTQYKSQLEPIMKKIQDGGKATKDGASLGSEAVALSNLLGTAGNLEEDAFNNTQASSFSSSFNDGLQASQQTYQAESSRRPISINTPPPAEEPVPDNNQLNNSWGSGSENQGNTQNDNQFSSGWGSGFGEEQKPDQPPPPPPYPGYGSNNPYAAYYTNGNKNVPRDGYSYDRRG